MERTLTRAVRTKATRIKLKDQPMIWRGERVKRPKRRRRWS